jgi:hypothetical protein
MVSKKSMDMTNNEQKTTVSFPKERDEKEPVFLEHFHEKEIWFYEGRLLFQAQAMVTTDDWGVCIRIEAEGRKPFTVSGRWDVIYVNPRYAGAHYCGWRISTESPLRETLD